MPNENGVKLGPAVATPGLFCLSGREGRPSIHCPNCGDGAFPFSKFDGCSRLAIVFWPIVIHLIEELSPDVRLSPEARLDFNAVELSESDAHSCSDWSSSPDMGRSSCRFPEVDLAQGLQVPVRLRYV